MGAGSWLGMVQPDLHSEEFAVPIVMLMNSLPTI